MALAKQEMQRLRYLETHQKEIRAELYKRLADAVDAHDHAGGREPLQAGQRVILPSSFTGGPRDMHRRYHDGALPPTPCQSVASPHPRASPLSRSVLGTRQAWRSSGSAASPPSSSR